MRDAASISVVLLAGGVGGAKMAEGFAHLENVDLTVIGNVADDDEFHGLWISPDIDTMIYTLSDRINREQGWGVADESLRALSVLTELGQDTWMTLGDRDFGLHIYRSARLKQGHNRQAITDDICRAFDVPAQIILSTEDVIQTRVRTATGWLSFQEYFVREQCKPDVLEISCDGLAEATANPQALAAIGAADVIVIAPSNPLVSIHPIMGIGGIGEALRSARIPKLAVSPLVGGKALKGPADRMMISLGLEASVGAIAKQYADVVDVLVIDETDQTDAAMVVQAGLKVEACNIVMKSREDKVELARHLVRITSVGETEGVL